MQRQRRQRRRRIALAAIALALLGPGRPIVLTALNDAAKNGSVAVSERVPSAAADGPGTWTVEIDLVDETSQPPHDASGFAYVPSASKRHALIVGIDHARGGKPLPGSVTDAKNVRDALLMYGFRNSNIDMLLEQEASRNGIRAGLERLAKRTPSNGTAVFAIATHSRRIGGRNELLTADGLRISSYELASALGKVRGQMWVALPTCYSAGYALPGIVGKNRLAVFASSADEEAYQLGGAGSFLIMTMVGEAMLERRAPASVEDAFAYAKRELEAKYPKHVPSMNDGVRGDLVLGDVPPVRTYGDVEAISPKQDGGPPHRWYTSRSRSTAPTTTRTHDRSEPAPSEPEGRRSRGGVGVCGTYRARC